LLVQTQSEAGTDSPSQKAADSIRRRDPDIEEYLPILLNAFGLADAAMKEPLLEPEIRRSLLWKMTGLLLEEVLERETVHCVIDGAHWLDGESLSLLMHLLRTMDSARLKIHLTLRCPLPDEEGICLHQLSMPPFSEEETGSYIREALSARDVPQEAVNKVFGSSHGNPLLTKETLNLLFQSGYLSRDQEYPQVLLVDESRSPELPDSIAGLVLSQIDALPLADRALLRTLSVVGETIPASIAGGLGLDLTRLEALASENHFIQRDPTRKLYRFIQGLAASAIYDSLEFEQKRDLHIRIGDLLREQVSKEDPQRCYLLSHHYGRANTDQAIPYLLEVAQRARAAYAIADALQALESALAISNIHHLHSDEMILDLAALYLLGGRAEAAALLVEKHGALLSLDHQGAANRLLAEAYAAMSQIPFAEHALAQALDRARSEKDRFLAFCALGKLYGKTGRMEKAREIIEKVGSEFQQFGDEKEYKMNQMRLAFMKYQAGQRTQAIPVFARLKTFFEKKGDAVAAYTLGNNLGHLLALGGRNKRALTQFLGAYALIKKYGIWESEIFLSLTWNIGLQYLDFGDLEQAESHFLNALAYAKRHSSPLLYKPYYLLGEVETHKGDLDKAMGHLTEAKALCRKTSLPAHEVLEQLMSLAQVTYDEALYRSVLQEYMKEIKDNHLQYLKAEMTNFEAEGEFLSGDPSRFIEKEKNNLAECLEEEQYIEAYRAARFLLKSTRSSAYLKAMENALTRCAKRAFHIDFRYHAFLLEPTPARRQSLKRVLRRCPYSDLKWKAFVALAERETNPGTRLGLSQESFAIIQHMLEGLDARTVGQFKTQPIHLQWMAMAAQERLSE
jgi:hypothetical protein